MRFRKLRIAWSVACGIACALVIVLWVLSYWWTDSALIPISRTQAVDMGSSLGRLRTKLHNNIMPETGWLFGHRSHAKLTKEVEEILSRNGAVSSIQYPSWPVFGQCSDGNFRVAHWIVVLFFATLGIVAAPCIKWRFSLRTLLIATTLVAVVLGVIAWSIR